MEIFYAIVFGVISSLIATAIVLLYNSERSANDPIAFEKRSKIFHSRIAPYLVNDFLAKKSPEIHKRLTIHATPNGPIKRLPYIKLIDTGIFKVSEALHEGHEEFPKNQKFINWLKGKIGKKVVNNPTFRLVSYNDSGELSIGIGDYESTISTSDKNYFDLIRYFPVSNLLFRRELYKRGKHVTRWIKFLERAVLTKHFGHYIASIGCSVLTVIKKSDVCYYYLIKENSSEKSSAASEKHVMPSFMFQPVSSTAGEQEKEINLNLSVLREYGEEVLAMPEVEDAANADTLKNYIYQNPLLDKMAQQIEDGDAVLQITGFCIDIFRLRPEITFLLVLNDVEFSKNITLNWESKGKKPFEYNICSDEAYNKLIHDDETPLCPPGLAALINGRSRAIKIINSSVS